MDVPLVATCVTNEENFDFVMHTLGVAGFTPREWENGCKCWSQWGELPKYQPILSVFLDKTYFIGRRLYNSCYIAELNFEQSIPIIMRLGKE